MLPLFPAGILPPGGSAHTPVATVAIGGAGVSHDPAAEQELKQLRLQIENWKKRAEQAEAALDSVLEPVPALVPHAPLLAAIQRSTRVSEFREPPGYFVTE